MGKTVVIVGAGHAGGSAAAFLRQYGHGGPVVVLGDEPLPPYQRPPLSKAWLKGEAVAEDLELRPASFYAEHNIELRLGVTVEGLDRKAHRVSFDKNEVLSYDALILATGARPRRLALPGVELEGVFELRTVADARALKTALGPSKKLIVIGGGYIGLEAAASARALGSEVVVIEREPRLLARVACPVLSDFFKAYHEARGVRFEMGVWAERLEGEGGRVRALRLNDGRRLECDAVLIGVGAEPNDALARDAGLKCENGVVVDEAARTSDPDIYAAGDVTWRPMPLYGRMFRLESVPNALEQAKQAAAAICGRPAPAHETPWFWSDQYDLKLQIAGVPFEAEDLIIRGEPALARFAVFHMKGDLVQAVEAVNAPAEFMGGKALIGARKPVSRARLADPSVSMKAVAD